MIIHSVMFAKTANCAHNCVSQKLQHLWLQVQSAAGDRMSPYVVRITNDLYQAPQKIETVVTNRMTQRTAGSAETAAAKAAANAVAAAVGPIGKAGVANKVGALSTTGLAGLQLVCLFEYLLNVVTRSWFLCLRLQTVSAKALCFRLLRPFVRPSVRSFVRFSGQMLLPRYLMYGFNIFNKTHWEYSLAPIDDLLTFWRSKVNVSSRRAVEVKSCVHHSSGTT